MAPESIVRFRHRLAAKAQRCYRQRDIPGILAVLGTIERKMSSTDDVLAKGRLDTSAAQVIALAAEAHLDDLQFEECFGLCQQAKNVLDNATRRYLDAGQPPAANSMVWCSLLHILADAKWKIPAPDQFNRVMKLKEMHACFFRITRRVLAVMPQMGYDADEMAANQQSLLWAGIMLYKQALRYMPGKLGDLEQTMNEIQSGVLEDESQPFFWDVHIAKHVLSGVPQRSRLTYLYNQRRCCFDEKLLAPAAISAYERSAAKEMEHLLDCRLKLR